MSPCFFTCDISNPFLDNQAIDTRITMRNAGTDSNSVLTELSKENLAAAVELNSAAHLRLEAHIPWAQFHEEPDVLRIFTGDSWPRNTVALARFTPANADKRIAKILDEHLQHKVACNWIVGPLSQPSDLGKYLCAQGFSCRIHCAGMACRLQDSPPETTLDKDTAVSLVDAPPLLVPLSTELRRKQHEARQIIARLRPRRLWCFSATVKGVPAGETIICAGAGVAGIYSVVVKEKFRRRGIGSALLRAALCQARELGFKAAVLSATGMGQTLYRRLDFEEVCKLSFWKYGKMRQQ